MRGVRYLVFVLAVQLAHLAVHQVLDGVDFGLHLLLGGLQLVLQFTDERFTAAAVQRSLKHGARVNGRGNTQRVQQRPDKYLCTFIVPAVTNRATVTLGAQLRSRRAPLSGRTRNRRFGHLPA